MTKYGQNPTLRKSSQFCSEATFEIIHVVKRASSKGMEM